MVSSPFLPLICGEETNVCRLDRIFQFTQINKNSFGKIRVQAFFTLIFFLRKSSVRQSHVQFSSFLIVRKKWSIFWQIKILLSVFNCSFGYFDDALILSDTFITSFFSSDPTLCRNLKLTNRNDWQMTTKKHGISDWPSFFTAKMDDVILCATSSCHKTGTEFQRN